MQNPEGGGSGHRYDQRHAHVGGEHRRHLTSMDKGMVSPASHDSEAWNVSQEKVTVGGLKKEGCTRKQKKNERYEKGMVATKKGLRGMKKV